MRTIRAGRCVRASCLWCGASGHRDSFAGDQHVEERRLPPVQPCYQPPRVLRLVHQLCHGLRAAHSLNGATSSSGGVGCSGHAAFVHNLQKRVPIARSQQH